MPRLDILMIHQIVVEADKKKAHPRKISDIQICLEFERLHIHIQPLGMHE